LLAGVALVLAIPVFAQWERRPSLSRHRNTPEETPASLVFGPSLLRPEREREPVA